VGCAHQSAGEKYRLPLPVTRFLGLHFIERVGGRRISFPQTLSEIAIYAAVFFFKLNCEREDLALGRFIETLLGHKRRSLGAVSASNHNCASLYGP